MLCWKDNIASVLLSKGTLKFKYKKVKNLILLVYKTLSSPSNSTSHLKGRIWNRFVRGLM
jgi:hypothetical protein